MKTLSVVDSYEDVVTSWLAKRLSYTVKTVGAFFFFFFKDWFTTIEVANEGLK